MKQCVCQKEISSRAKFCPACGINATRLTHAAGYTLAHALVPLSDLVTSHTALGGINPGFDSELQPRDRGRLASISQIETIASRLDPHLLLTDQHALDRGSPIVDTRNHVLSGNGRVSAMRIADLSGYWHALRESASQFGVSPFGMDQPVLVRVLFDNAARADLVHAANASSVLTMSPLETAYAESRLIDSDMLSELTMPGDSSDIDRTLRSSVNRGVIQKYLHKLPANERAALLTREGDLNQAGLYRFKAALLAAVFGSPGELLAESLLESLDSDVKNVQNAIMAAIPAIAQAVGMMRQGIRANSTFATDLAIATTLLAQVRSSEVWTKNVPSDSVITSWLGQSRMFDDNLTSDQTAMLIFLDQNRRSAKTIRLWLQAESDRIIRGYDIRQEQLFA